MADPSLALLGGALVQALTPIPAIERSTAQATAQLTSLTSELQADYRSAKQAAPWTVLAAAVLWGAWYWSRRRAAARPARHRARLHGRRRRSRPRRVSAGR